MASGSPWDTESATEHSGTDPSTTDPSEIADPSLTDVAATDEPSTARPRRGVIDRSSLAEWERSRPMRARRRPGWRARPVLLGAGVTLLVVILIAAGGLFWIDGHLSGNGGATVQVQLPADASHGSIASALGKAHVVSDSWLFRRYLDYRGVSAPSGGMYKFHLHEGYRAALRDLDAGPVVSETRLTIPEGFDLKQTAAAVGRLPGLSGDRFLQLATTGAVHSPYQQPGANNLEGLIFPDTYFVSPQDNEQTILQRMVDRFDQVAASVGLDQSAATNGLSPYQTVVLASLIEREAKIDADRGKISRVIVNRLAKGMKLEIDATVEYAEGVHKPRLLDSDLRTQSPYNTYLVTGLPPGPIAAPGKASLLAALNPTPGPWLYYVLIDPSGAHGFATTPAEFDRLKQEAHAKGLL